MASVLQAFIEKVGSGFFSADVALLVIAYQSMIRPYLVDLMCEVCCIFSLLSLKQYDTQEKQQKREQSILVLDLNPGHDCKMLPKMLIMVHWWGFGDQVSQYENRPALWLQSLGAEQHSGSALSGCASVVSHGRSTRLLSLLGSICSTIPLLPSVSQSVQSLSRLRLFATP